MPKKLTFLILIFLGAVGFMQGQVPAYGLQNRLDVACWNIEWFGDNQNGPSNETRQFNNVLEVFRNSDIDVWGLQEISSNITFNRLLDSLPEYEGVVAPYSQTQKTALVYDTSLFTLLYSKVVLTQYDYDFASGRFPFEVGLAPKWDLQDTHIFLVVHLKANTGNSTAKQEAWQRRKNASGHMYTYLNNTYPKRKCMIIGDFNDDTDISIHNSNVTPFSLFVQDANNYRFLTTSLSANNEGSTVGRSDVVDHILITNEWFSAYFPNSCTRLRLDQHLISYGFSTSDHYPIFAAFNIPQTPNVSSPNTLSLGLYPNPLPVGSKLELKPGVEIVQIHNLQGQGISKIQWDEGKVEAGVYFLQLQWQGKTFAEKILVQ